VPEESVSALRVKLGFNRRTENKMPRSTADLPPGASVLLKNHKGTTLKARILPPKTEAFRLMSQDDAQGFTSGTAVALYYPHRSGIIRFDSHVNSLSKGLIQLSHSEEAQRIQRREYYRQKVSFPAYIKQAGKNGDPIKGRFIDISEGGANIEVPEKIFAHAGNTVEISFHPDSEDNLSLLGSVVRISHKGRRLHVKFRNLRQKARNKILKTVFSRSRRNGA
jgi:c-di-GMP-binding flagellar brake protein YcgR